MFLSFMILICFFQVFSLKIGQILMTGYFAPICMHVFINFVILRLKAFFTRSALILDFLEDFMFQVKKITCQEYITAWRFISTKMHLFYNKRREKKLFVLNRKNNKIQFYLNHNIFHCLYTMDRNIASNLKLYLQPGEKLKHFSSVDFLLEILTKYYYFQKG